ncbi:MAG: ATP-binding cassette domain-containing protein [Thermoplasmataceae archaeon]
MLAQDKLQEKEEGSYLRVENLETRFFTSKGIVKAIDNLSLKIGRGEVYGLVGESGCGKSVTALSIMDLIQDPPGRITAGKIYIDGYNVIGDLKKLAKVIVKSETDVKIKRNKRLIKRHNAVISKIRGEKIAMIFQEPFLAMNPVLKVGDQISESILLHDRIDIANSIIRREKLTKEVTDSFIEYASAIKDVDSVRKEINSWTREYGVPNAELSIVQLIRSQSSIDEKKLGLYELIQDEKQGVDLDAVFEVREYYKQEDKLADLLRQLSVYEEAGDATNINRVSAEISQIRRDSATKNITFKLKMKFQKKRYQKPFNDEARRRTLELLKLVNIAGAERVIDSYPHELSGGMLQRCMIAMALSSNPKMLIADEPTTALDVTTQAQILELIKNLNKVMNSSILFITHDLAVIAEMCQRVGVMYAGNLVEEAPVETIFSDMKHPYTMGLMSSIPRPDKKRDRNLKLESIPGTVPNLITPPSGCRFHPRCKFSMDICSEKKPKLVELGEGHKVACFLYSQEVEEN